MAKKMLIDASHPEEMRMAIMDGQRLEGLETESFNKKQLKGNIYLAKVIRIEPSLQAAFVEFGGNRQGFLPFGEIHPDYYHIPVGDRPEVIDVPESLTKEESSAIDIENASHALDVALDEDSVIDDSVTSNDVEDEVITPSADDDDFDEDSVRKRPNRYRYKIQEVIKRRQIMLVQVVKEERGGKGAALTTFLSLPGRYCVHMPNSGERRGGISRKISDTKNRARIRAILDSIDIPDGMSLIVRTAGSDKNKTELKKDFEYLLRLWSDIREKTLISIAPALIYAEGDLIKRALRDTFTKDMEHVYIEGDEAYKAAKAFMKTMSPSQAKKVIQYKEKQVPLFQKYHIEDLVDEMFQPSVSLPSGGSIVLAQTEALVAIDVNSGKATRERHIDETALKTNIEAAREIARQLRLRDLAGLIVVDFIDMNDRGHVAQVERVFKESLQGDRARIQLGKISQFGLMEMSRQRLRPSLMESNTRECPHCHGAGFVRSVESMALFVLRQLEGAALANPGANLHVAVPADVDLYLLNQKRQTLVELESKYNLSIIIQRDSKLKNTEHHLTIHHPHGQQAKQEMVTPDQVHDSDGKSPDHGRTQQRNQPSKHQQQREPRHKNQQRHTKDVALIEAEIAPAPSMEGTTTEASALQTTEKQGDRTRRRHPRHRNNQRTVAEAVTEELMMSAPELETKQIVGEPEGSEGVKKQDQKRRRRRRDRGRHKKVVESSVEGAGSETHAFDSASTPKAANVLPTKLPKTSKAEAPANTTSSGADANKDDGSDSQKKGWWKRLIES